MQGSTVWVTGAAGFLGRAVARRFLREGWSVVGLGHARSAPEPVDMPFLAGEVGPALLTEALDRYGPPAVVMHAAGGASVGSADADPAVDFQRSVVSTAALVHVLGRRAPDAHLILPSSAAVYGSRPAGPIPETAEIAPISHYGWHKAQCEQICRQAHRQYGLGCTVIRFFSLYGAGLTKQVLWDVGGRLLAGSGPVDVAGTGTETRDLLHVDDAADLVATLAAAPPEGAGGIAIVNGGTGIPVPIGELLERLSAALGASGRIRFTGERRAGDPVHYQADIARLWATGFRPRQTLDEGVTAYAGWLRQRLEGPEPR